MDDSDDSPHKDSLDMEIIDDIWKEVDENYGVPPLDEKQDLSENSEEYSNDDKLDSIEDSSSNGKVIQVDYENLFNDVQNVEDGKLTIDEALGNDSVSDSDDQLKTKFQNRTKPNLIEVTATLIVFAGRLLCASIINMLILIGIAGLYFGIVGLLLYLIHQIYYFFNSDSSSSGIIGDIAGYVGKGIISIIGTLVLGLGELIKACAGNTLCQGIVVFVILIIGLSNWAKKLADEISQLNEKSRELIRSWWYWAFAPLKTLKSSIGEHDDLTVAQLKELLREEGLPVSGKKAELIARLKESKNSIQDIVEVDQ